MPLYAFVAPLQPGKTDEYRQFVAELGGPRKTEYETSRKDAGFHRETIFLQKTPMGEMVVVVQEAENAEKAMDSLRSMKDPFNVWFFQKIKDFHGIDVVGNDMPMNELLLDYRV
ncbi:MAG: DUF6176 family protein [Thermoplasmata archaeon]|jgi:hypothetical protein